MKRKVVLFSVSFPYYIGGENTFIQFELPHLSSVFEEVIIVPSEINGDSQLLDQKIRLEKGFSKYLSQKSFINKASLWWRILFSKYFYEEIKENPKIIFNLKDLFRLFNYLIKSFHQAKWLRMFIIRNKLNDSSIVFYTYWKTPTTTAIAMLKKYYKNIILISRAHGIDLYKDQSGFIPCQKSTIENLDFFYLVSKKAKDYVLENITNNTNKVKLNRLGILNHQEINPLPDSSCFRIVSCSGIIKIKRVNLLLSGIIQFANNNKNNKIEWIHYGDGKENEGINLLIKEAPSNLSCILNGQTRNAKILSFYRKTAVNIFVTTSQSEGGCPVSIQEAYSFGIPAIATSVGGVPEIVNNENGILLSSNPTTNDIESALNWFLKNPDLAINKRIASRKTFENYFDADKNFAEFAKQLNEIA